MNSPPAVLVMADGGIQLDELLRILAVEERRQILSNLLRSDPPWTIDDIAGSQLTLVHYHLPMLEDHDVIRWDREAGTIGRGDEWERAKAGLDVVEEYRRSLVD